MARGLFVSMAAFTLFACTDPGANGTGTPASAVSTSAERLSLGTCDGVELIGELAVPDGVETPDVVAVFAHPRGSDRRTWRPLLRRFHGEGIPTLAIDMRGHGESNTRRGETIDHDSFREQDWLDMHRDVVRAGEIMRDRFPGVPQVFVGLGEGGTAALQAATVSREARGVIVFGTAELYSGVRLNVTSRRLRDKALLLVRARSDGAGVVDAARAGERTVRVYDWPGRLILPRQLAGDTELWREIMQVMRPAQASG